MIGLAGLPEVGRGDDLAGLVLRGLSAAGLSLVPGDVLVVTQKVVSKAEGCEVDLAAVEPSPLALRWAAAWRKDSRMVEVVLREAVRVLRMDRGVLIAETPTASCAPTPASTPRTAGPGSC